MSLQVSTENRPSVLVNDMVVKLENTALGECAEISTALGFNCFRWAVSQERVELLHADPHMYQGVSPTRTGIPILFPFPNRIRDGRFTWDGQGYRLTPNDPAGKNAIHGFACRRRWRLLTMGADQESAWVSGEFHGSFDAADCAGLWPSDYRIRVTYRLAAHRLLIDAVVDNPDDKPLPFGLGYHPYLALASDRECTVRVPAEKYWQLHENLPTGEILPVDGGRDLRGGASLQERGLDDVLTGLASAEGDLLLRGVLRREAGIEIEMWTSPDFREMVVFTPPHRKAVCLEPYTCTTDAINLQQRGVYAGLKVLQPGESWRGVIEMRVTEVKSD